MDATTLSEHIHHPPGFRPRRGLNWGLIGLLYTSFYMCRYNLSFANSAICDEYGFNNQQFGVIITVVSLAYGVGQIINGLLTDKMGGKKAMIIGAAGTILMNVAFGALSLVSYTKDAHGTAVVSIFGGMSLSMLTLFAMVRGIDNYMQAWGAPGMIKINAAWFAKRERGKFAGIFGFMINLGRFGIGKFGPALLAGFSLFWIWHIPPAHWRWLFWVPACVCAVMALLMAMFVKQTPEECGFHHLTGVPEDHHAAEDKLSVWDVLQRMAASPVLWFTAGAYGCTGVVRKGLDEWWPKLLEKEHHLDRNGSDFQLIVLLIPIVASLGSFISGWLSDTVFKGRRAPVALGIYALESLMLLLAAQFHSTAAVMTFIVLIALTANSTHSLLGTASAIDIGGRRMAGFTSGLIDSFQYFGGALSGWLLGKFLDGPGGWNYYFYFMLPFGLLGAVFMAFIVNRPIHTGAHHHEH